MMRKPLIVGMLVTGLTLIAATPFAGPPQIERWVIGGGGGSATVGSASLRSTVGQWMTGGGGSGDARLQSGFWSGVTTATENHALYLPLIFK